MIDIKNLKITELTPFILREIECILDEDKKAKIMKILNGEYKKYYTEFIEYHKNPKYRDIIENWFMYGSIVFDTSKFDTHKYTFFDQDNTYFLLDTESGIKDFEDYLNTTAESSEKEWRPKYPIMTRSEFKDRLEHAGNIPRYEDIMSLMKYTNPFLILIKKEFKISGQQRFLIFSEIIIDYKLMEELEFDLFGYFSKPNAIRNMSNFEDRQWLRGELEAMGIEITYTEKNKK